MKNDEEDKKLSGKLAKETGRQTKVGERKRKREKQSQSKSKKVKKGIKKNEK